MDKVFVPPIKIQGIKTKLIPLIAEYIYIKKNTTWIEPFMGSGVVGFNLAPHNAIFADVNPYVIQFYKAIQKKDVTPSIARHFLETEGEKLKEGDADYYYEVRNRFNSKHEPLDFLFLNRSCFNGMIRFNKDGLFNVPYGHKPERFAKAYITKIVNQISFDLNAGNLKWRDLTGNGNVNFAQQVSSDFNVATTLEENLHEYSGLIYDGAYSEHIISAEKKALKGEKISEEDAKNKAQEFIGKENVQEITNLGLSGNGTIPAYSFNIKNKNN